jgi:hypothetical protein
MSPSKRPSCAVQWSLVPRKAPEGERIERFEEASERALFTLGPMSEH